LGLASIITGYLNWVCFFVFGTFDFKYLIVIVIPTEELVVLKRKDLEPSRVGGPDLHIVGLTSILDVP